ncbi:MAG: LysR family transcriptional regulator [Rubrivivax sp.]
MFVKVAQRGSYRAAAIDLGVSPQAVSKGIDALERELKLWLFRRNTRRLALTDDGERLLPLARQALESTGAFYAAAAPEEAEIAGPVRIAAPLAFGSELVSPLVLELAQRHPLLQPELLLQDALNDVVADHIDVGVRAGKPDDSRLVVRAVAQMQLLVCASPDYLARHGVPARWEDLLQHRLTGYRKSTTGKVLPWERVGPGGELVNDMFPAHFLCNDVQTELQAVLAGVGIGQLAGFSAVRHLRSGALKLLFPESVGSQYQLYVYRLRHERMPARVRLVFEHLVQSLAAHADLQLGEAELAAFSVAPPARRLARVRA